MDKNFIVDKFNINRDLYDFFLKCEKDIQKEFEKIEEVVNINQSKVLWAMQKNRLSEVHFQSTTGYGYNDLGRDVLENIYKDIFGAEDAIVRGQIISGTHALTTALFANLKSGDELLSPVGTPYDTLQGVIGIRKTKGSLMENGVSYKEVGLINNSGFDYDEIKKAITSKTKMVTIQRSKGYSFRKSFTISELRELIMFIREIKKDLIIMIDNCYGEFVETIEPIEVGADLAVGSLIKNLGGGIAPVGGYIVGKKELIENCSYRLTAPGLGKEVGPSLGVTHKILQGLFLSPSVVGSSLKTATLASYIFEKLGFLVNPKYNEKRGDIVQSVKFGTEAGVVSFCRGIQNGAPVDSFLTAEGWDMPGYDCPVIMASGSFVSGSSIELSADAPIKEPYIAFFQGGLNYNHGRLGILIALNKMYIDGLIKLVRPHH